MRRHTSMPILGLLLVTALGACAEGESRDAPADEAVAGETPAERGGEAPTADASPVVPAGTSMTFTVGETVTSAEHEAGDLFTATLAAPVQDADGSVLLPAGTESRWVVTESTSDGGPEGEALLAFRLRSLSVEGEWVPVTATVTGTDVRTSKGDSGTETAAKVAVGAAAGAIIGQILGKDTESTLAGAGVGAAVGTVVALTTRDGEARLERGSTITVRLDEPVTSD